MQSRIFADQHKPLVRAMYDAFPDLPAIYDSVPVYVTRRDVQFYVEEAKEIGGSVLEVGCGTGRILLPIARSGRTIDGLQTALPDGRTLRRAGRVARVRRIDQVSEIELTYYISSGPGAQVERHVQSFDMRWFLRAELVHLLSRSGFRVRSIYGDFDRSPLTDKSPEQIVCAERVTAVAT